MKSHTGSLSDLNPNSNTFIPNLANLDMETTFIPNQVLIPDPSLTVDDSPGEESEPHHINILSDQTVEVPHAKQIQQTSVANNNPNNQVAEQRRPEPIIEPQEELTQTPCFDHDLNESELRELLGDNILEEASTSRRSGRRPRRPVYNETALYSAQSLGNC